MIKEFREFAMRGNVVDLAVGFILGGAFATIVSSLVNDIVMPPIGMLMGGVDFAQLFAPLDGQDYASLEAAREAGAATINYGLFINSVISFLILALALFFMIRAMNRVTRSNKEEPLEAAPARPRQEELLEEIRDLLKRERGAAS